MGSAEIHTDLMDQFNAQKGKRDGRIKGKMSDRNRVDAFKRQRDMVDRLHEKLPGKLAAHHKGRELVDEDTQQRITRRKEALGKMKNKLRERMGKWTPDEKEGLKRERRNKNKADIEL